MATLEKLIIFGIRNFNPNDDPQVIKFASPLTLFLGQNGCGKTTIMECLKYGLSGELPAGSNRGQGFLYDPKMNETVETKGQIKLRFHDEKHNEYTVFKSMTVLAKKSGLTFSKENNSIKIKSEEGKDENMMSGRCANIDETVCELLGVSKSVLNNVIFCHQEDSLWPLDEGSKLKKKFDEIFEVTQYHKCADQIRKLIKEKGNKIKILQAQLSHCEDKKNEAEKKQMNLVEREEKCRSIVVQISEKEKKLEPIRLRLKEICDLQNRLMNLQKQLSEKQSENRSISEQTKIILKNIKHEEYKGTDAELKNEIDNFDKNRSEFETKLKEYDKEKADVETQETLITQKKNKLLADLGKLQLEKKNHGETINKRKELMTKMWHDLKIDAQLEFNDDVNVENVMDSIKDATQKLKTSFEKLSKDLDMKEVLLQNDIDRCRDNVNKAKHSIDSKRSQIHENKRKSREISSQLQELNFSDDQLKNIKNKIDSIDRDLQTAKEKFEEQGVTQSTIDKEKSNIKKLEEELEELEEEMKLLVKNSITEAEIESKKTEVKKRQSEIVKLKNKHHDNFQLLFPEGVPTTNLKDAVQAIKVDSSKKVININNKINDQQKALTSKETQLKFTKQKLKDYEGELKAMESKISQYATVDTFEKTKSDLTQITEKLRKDRGQYASAKVMYQKFIEEFESDKCCPLCRTQFSNKEQAVAEIVADIKNKIKEIPFKLKKVEEELKQKENELSKLTELTPVHAKTKEMSDRTIPTVAFEIDMIKTECEQASAELEKLKADLKPSQEMESVCNAVLPDAALIDQYNLEIVNSEEAIENLGLQIIKVDSQRTRQETETEIDNIKMELENARRNHENFIKKLQQFNNRCHDLRETRSKYVQKQLDIQKVMQGKPQLEEHLADLSGKVEQLENEITELESTVQPLKKELEEAERKRNKVKEENKKTLEAEQANLHQNEKLLDNIDKYSKEINDYVKENKDAIFEKMVDKSVKFEQLLRDLANSKTRIIDESTEIKRKHGALELEFRILMDNVELREKRKKQGILAEEIQVLNTRIGNHDEQSLSDEKMNLQREDSKIDRDINTDRGRKSELENSIKELQKELNQPELKLAPSKYKSKFYEVKVTEQAVKDLKEFLVAFEYSVMYFHKERMVQINKTIREYWRSIYRGNDIDHIEIKTDQAESSSSTNRRIYNYKVIQVKNDVEMEMRGRCSAGQKVLASIIIRMALAETFSRKCGILALDEPTTNLDRQNILSLSEALANIVTARSNEKNFQLLVITHDEEFLKALTSIDKVSYINRVCRNEKGNSVVRIEYL